MPPSISEAGELVAERHTIACRHQHPRSQALVEPQGCFLHHGLHEPELGLRGHDGDRLEDGPCCWAKGGGASEDYFSDGGRDFLSPRSESLDNEERVPCRPPVELIGVDAVPAGKLSDRCQAKVGLVSVASLRWPWRTRRARVAGGEYCRARSSR